MGLGGWETLAHGFGGLERPWRVGLGGWETLVCGFGGLGDAGVWA